MTITPRGTRSMDMGRMGIKQFGMSQPVLSVNPEQTMSDNEDHSDGSGSPSQHNSRPASSARPMQPSSQPAQQPVLAAVKSSNSRHGAPPQSSPGLPSVTPSPTQAAIDGLPAPVASAPCTNPFRSCYMPPRKDEVVSPPSGVVPSESNTSGVTESTSRDSSEVSVSAFRFCSMLKDPVSTRHSTAHMKMSLLSHRQCPPRLSRPCLLPPQSLCLRLQ